MRWRSCAITERLPDGIRGVVAPRAEAPSGPGGHSGLGLWRILKASGAPEDYARNLATSSISARSPPAGLAEMG